MKIDWKTFSLAMIISIIVTGVSGLILSISNIILAYPDLFEYYQSLSPYGSTVTMTIAQTGYGPPYVLHLWMLIVLFLICLAVLTIIFYFVIGYLRKKKK